MTKKINHIQITDLTQVITLYQKQLQQDIIRPQAQTQLQPIGQFNAYSEAAHFTKPDQAVAQIYQIKKIFVRVSNFYRDEFIKDNYIKHKQGFMRIASSQFSPENGITCCICYDVNDFQ